MPFAMIPAEGAPTGFSQNTATIESQARSSAPSTIASPPKEIGTPQARTPTRQLELSSLSDPERQSIESVCSHAKYLEGRAAYNKCLQAQLAHLEAGPRRPSLSNLNGPEQQSVESVCSQAKYLEGPTAYNRCLQDQLVLLAKAPRRPDLSSLSGPEQQSIESVCSQAKYLEGSAAYNRCLVQQLALLKNSR